MLVLFFSLCSLTYHFKLSMIHFKHLKNTLTYTRTLKIYVEEDMLVRNQTLLRPFCHQKIELEFFFCGRGILFSNFCFYKILIYSVSDLPL